MLELMASRNLHSDSHPGSAIHFMSAGILACVKWFSDTAQNVGVECLAQENCASYQGSHFCCTIVCHFIRHGAAYNILG